MRTDKTYGQIRRMVCGPENWSTQTTKRSAIYSGIYLWLWNQLYPWHGEKTIKWRTKQRNRHIIPCRFHKIQRPAIWDAGHNNSLCSHDRRVHEEECLKRQGDGKERANGRYEKTVQTDNVSNEWRVGVQAHGSSPPKGRRSIEKGNLHRETQMVKTCTPWHETKHINHELWRETQPQAVTSFFTREAESTCHFNPHRGINPQCTASHAVTLTILCQQSVWSAEKTATTKHSRTTQTAETEERKRMLETEHLVWYPFISRVNIEPKVIEMHGWRHGNQTNASN